MQIETNSLFIYPDLSIVCGPIEFWNKRNDTILNSSVIIEVLSPGTEGYDRGQNFKLYRGIPALQEYILIASREAGIEQYTRQFKYFWSFREIKSSVGSLQVETIGFSCPLSEVYRGVIFD